MMRLIVVGFAGCVILAAGALRLHSVSSGEESSAGPVFQSHLGSPLDWPAAVPSELGEMHYSPDGTRLAVSARRSIWVWEFSSGEVTQLAPTPADAEHGYSFGGFFWADADHILACETGSNFAEVAAFMANHDAPLNLTTTWALVNIHTGERVRGVSDSVNGDADGLHILGVVDKDVWYIKAPDGKLRSYDSRTQTVGSQAYFTYGAGEGTAVQTAPGSPWFSAVVLDDPYSPDAPVFGRLDVLNILTGEKRSISNVLGRTKTVTADGRFFFTSTMGNDGGTVPILFDLAQGLQVPLPAGERWGLEQVSSARGVVLVTIRIPTDVPNKYKYQYVEVPLAALTQM